MSARRTLANALRWLLNTSAFGSDPTPAVDTTPAPCTRPPAGWSCSQPADHKGPCPATPDDATAEQILWVSQPPHCDSAILHSPGVCEYCDLHPDWQAYRLLAHISFSDHEATLDAAPCPSTWFRNPKVRDAWAGNRPPTA